MQKPAAFWHWAAWRLHNKTGPRPTDAPPKIPAEWWSWLEHWAARHHKKPTPPPTPPPPIPNNPPSQWKNAPWTQGKYVAISHGLRHNDGVWTIDQLIQRLQASGTKSVSPQIGDDCPDPNWAENARALYKAAKAVGIPCWGWGRVDYIDWDTIKQQLDSVKDCMDGFAADVEGRCVEPQLPEKLYAEYGSIFPLAVVATGGIDDAFGTGAIDSATRFGSHFDFIGQDYTKLGQGAPLTPAGGENFVYWRSTAKNAGQGYRHMPDALGRWHIPQGMSNAEGCPSMQAQLADWKPWAPHIGWWDGEIIEDNNEWGVWASL